MNVPSTKDVSVCYKISLYVFSLVTPMGALTIHMTLAAWLAAVPSPPFYLAIALSTWAGGMGPGMLSTLVSTLCVNFYFFSPIRDFSWTPPAVASSGMFAAVGLLLVVCCASVRRKMLHDAQIRQKITQAGRRSETTLRQVTENIRDIFYIAESAFFSVLYVSPAYETIFQASREELYEDGRSWMRHVHEEDMPIVEDALAQRAASGSYDVEYRIVSSDGQTHWIHDRTYPILDQLGRCVRVAGIAEDVTERKRSARNTAARHSAEARAQARSRALATVAHELRNPLSCVSLAVHRLRKAPLAPDERDAIYERIESLIDRMDGIIQSIMDMSRCESGGMVLHAQPVRVLGLLREAVESFPPETRKKKVGLQLMHHLEPDMEWNIDAPRLMQVVCNLIDNAIKFSIEGGRVELHAHVAQNALNISVSDTGAGIASCVQEHLFEPFWQGDQGDKRGLGLGLPIARSIVEAHHGRMWVESEEGHGSTFFVHLPRSLPAGGDTFGPPENSLR